MRSWFHYKRGVYFWKNDDDGSVEIENRPIQSVVVIDRDSLLSILAFLSKTGNTLDKVKEADHFLST